MSLRKRKSGFTVIEFLIVIAIMAILVAVGVPYFSKSKANQQVSFAAKELKHNLEYLRSVAVKQGTVESGESKPRLDFDSPNTASTGYVLKDKNGNQIKKVAFEGGVYADYSNVTGTVSFSPRGACDASGYVLIKNDKAAKYFKIEIVSSTGLVKFEELQ